MINAFVAPDTTNTTAYPEVTNAATNMRNQMHTAFLSITNQLNTDVTNKLNSTTNGSSGAFHVGMPNVAAGAGNSVESNLQFIYSEVSNATGGTIVNGSIEDVKLSDTTGQIKERVATSIAATDAFMLTKAAANGLASLDSAGLLTTNQAPSFSAGNITAYASTTIVSSSTTNYAEKVSLVCGNYGGLRISFNLNSGNAGTTVYGRIYRTGVAVGIERSTSSVSPTLYTEDITGWSPGDTIDLYLKTSNASVSSASNSFSVGVAVMQKIGSGY